MSRYLIDRIEQASNIEVRLRAEVVAAHGEDALEARDARATPTPREEKRVAGRSRCSSSSARAPTPTGSASTVARDAHGFILAGPDLRAPGVRPAGPSSAPPLPLETSLPGRLRGRRRAPRARSSASPARSGTGRCPSSSSTSTWGRWRDRGAPPGRPVRRAGRRRAWRSCRPPRPRSAWPPATTSSATGQSADRFCVLVEGAIEWLRMLGGEEVVMATRPAPTLLRSARTCSPTEPSLADGPGGGHSRLVRDPGLRLPPARCATSRACCTTALRLIAPVQQGAEAIMREREKLVALGTLSAGLAHELNNPAAAARRSASELADAARGAPRHPPRLRVAAGSERADAGSLVELQRGGGGARPSRRGGVGHWTAADREDVLVDLLDAKGLEGWRLAPPLAEAGIDEDWIARVEGHAGAALGARSTGWSASLTARGLVTRAARQHRPDLGDRRRGEGLHLHGPGADAARSTCTTASRAR